MVVPAIAADALPGFIRKQVDLPRLIARLWVNIRHHTARRQLDALKRVRHQILCNFREPIRVAVPADQDLLHRLRHVQRLMQVLLQAVRIAGGIHFRHGMGLLPFRAGIRCQYQQQQGNTRQKYQHRQQHSPWKSFFHHPTETVCTHKSVQNLFLIIPTEWPSVKRRERVFVRRTAKFFHIPFSGIEKQRQ